MFYTVLVRHFKSHRFCVSPFQSYHLRRPLRGGHVLHHRLAGRGVGLLRGHEVGLLQLELGEADVILQHVGVELLEGLQQVVAPEESDAVFGFSGLGVAVELLHRQLPRGEVLAQALYLLAQLVAHLLGSGIPILFELHQLQLQVANLSEDELVGLVVGYRLLRDVATDVLRVGIHRSRTHAATEVDVELQRSRRVRQQRTEQ